MLDQTLPPPLLHSRGVTLQYKTRAHLVTATYRVDFAVQRSDRFVLLGPSGRGKSTLLKAALLPLAMTWFGLGVGKLVFGVASGERGLGWYIFESKNELDIPEVFAGLLTIILIGLLVENVIFRSIEARTVRRWGMQN